MDRTETIKLYKKEIFIIDLKLKMKNYKDSSEHRALLDKKRELIGKMEALNSELDDNLDGQMGFAFDDLIELPQGNKKGR